MKTGLLPRLPQHKRFPLLSAPVDYVSPLEIDLRSQLLRSSDQKDTPKCAAYMMAGWLEFYRWKYDGIIAQIDPNPIYDVAKKHDGYPKAEGTTLQAVLNAAQELQLMSAVAQDRIREVYTFEEVKRGLHEHGVVLGAFMATNEWTKSTPDGWIQPGGSPLGGHAVLVCGYNEVEPRHYATVQNSWGAHVGWQGFQRLDLMEFRSSFQYGLVLEFPR